MDINRVENGSVILMCGDSTTDCGRGRPYGTYANSLGDSYVRRIHEIVTVTYPNKNLKFVNTGIAGDTSRGVKDRWVAECEAVKPDYATLLIGVNDVWRHYDRWLDKEYAVELDEYRDNLSFVAEYCRSNGISLTLIAPFFLELNKKDEFMARVRQYADVCKEVAEKYGCGFMDLQPMLDKLIKAKYTITFSPDRVHPTSTTHTAIALEILKKWKFKF